MSKLGKNLISAIKEARKKGLITMNYKPIPEYYSLKQLRKKWQYNLKQIQHAIENTIFAYGFVLMTRKILAADHQVIKIPILFLKQKLVISLSQKINRTNNCLKKLLILSYRGSLTGT